MTHRTVLRGMFALIVMLVLSAAGHAVAPPGLFRAYVSSAGNDSNPCTLPAPCRLLPAALTAVADGGEIWMLDSANYNAGPVNINKSVSILAVPGVVGSVVAVGGDAIVINAAVVRVTLRNLVIVPLPGGGGTNGINMINGAALTVENCLIANLPTSAILVQTAASVRIIDTTVRDNGFDALVFKAGASVIIAHATVVGNAGNGIYVLASGGIATTADIGDSTIGANWSGVVANTMSVSDIARVSVHDSRLIANTNYGAASETNGGLASIALSGNMISNNNNGIGALTAGAQVWAGGNTVSHNRGDGLNNQGGVFESAGNNALRNNGTNTSGTITVIGTN